MSRQIKLQLQPRNSEQCGQTCIAMITGLPLADVCRRFRSYRGTTDKHVCNMLRSLGVNCLDKRTGPNWFDYETAILCVREKTDKYGHWVVYHAGQVFCPSQGMNPGYLSRETLKVKFYIAIL